MNIIINDILMHRGVSVMDGAPGRGSGRYPLGSGKNPNQHSGDFASRVQKLRKEGFTYTDKDGKVWTGDTAIAKSLGMSTTDFRREYKYANNLRKQSNTDMARKLRAEGKSYPEIARIMGYKNESSIRAMLNEDVEERRSAPRKTADMLSKVVDEKGVVDVGFGVAKQLGITDGNLDEAVWILKKEGYNVYEAYVPQVTNPSQHTSLKLLARNDISKKEVFKDGFANVHQVHEDWVSHDGGETFDPKFVYPESMSSKRLKIRYKEDGGEHKDGVIEIRRGVPDLDLGGSHYSQVRILVDGTHYLKGMAVYSDDMPEGVDVVFNTNKKKGTPALGPKGNTVLKIAKTDKDNPFGSYIKEGIIDPDDPPGQNGGQSYYYDKNGKKKLSLINKREDEGGWGQWSNKLSSQFLSKQNEALIRKQLDLTKADKYEEFDELKNLTNPTVKRAMLMKFADDCDAAAVHLKAAGLPRQTYQVILPLTSIKDNEVYAPNFKDGETVALVRYPHGGTFEIPILKVNNKQKEGRQVIGTNPKDAIGINKKVADRLSGADFDGDTVMVIPCNNPRSKVKITSTPELEGLKNFDAKLIYGGKKEGTFKPMKDTQKQMGVVSNLITDMTIKGATNEELARAVRHSMVVIDAEKHGLDYKASEKDNNIQALKRKYQAQVGENGREHYGVSTLISRAKSEQRVPKRQGSARIDPETGEKIWKESGETYIDKKGRVQRSMQTSTKMAETKDARTLISSANSPAEVAYAEYANSMKALANQARKEAVNTPRMKQSKEAKTAYAKEVDSLDAKLNTAIMNAPRERQAQMMANSIMTAKLQENPDLKDKKSKDERKKLSQQALTKARTIVGAERKPIHVTDREWEAIQAGAIADSKLESMLKYIDSDDLRRLATPKPTKELSAAKQAKIKALVASGYTTDYIAEAVGCSTSTVNKYI